MPKVPSIQEGQRLRSGNPTGFQSAGKARRAGEAVAGFGRGVANLGKGMMAHQEKLRGVRRQNAMNDAKSRFTRGYQDIFTNIEKTGDGVDDVERFDADSGKVQSGILTQLNKKYKGEFAQEFTNIGGNVGNGFRGKTSNTSVTRFQNTVKKEMVQTNAQFSGLAFDAPDNLESLSLDYSTAMRTSLELLDQPESRIEAQIKDGNTALAKSGLDGLLRQRRYRDAQDLVTKSSFSQHFTGDQQREETDRIRTMMMRDISFTHKQEDRGRLEDARNVEKRQEAKFTENISRMAIAEKSGNPVMIQVAQDVADTDFADGKLAYKQFAGIKAFGSKGLKAISDETSYDISRIAFKANDKRGIQKARTKTLTSKASGDLSAPKAENWLKFLAQKEAKFSSDPTYQKKMKGYRIRAKGFVGSDEDFAQKMVNKYDTEAGKQQALKRYQYLSDFELISVRTGDPDYAFTKATADHFPGTKSMEVFPGWGQTVTTTDDYRKFYTWGVTTIAKGTDSWEKFKMYASMAKNAIHIDSMLQQLPELGKEVQQLEKEHQRGQQEIEAKGFLEDFLDLNQIMSSPRKDELPYILQNLE